MVSVINLLSDDEDESPNKAAKSALESFGARKEPRSEKGRPATGAGREHEDALESSKQAAKTTLASFTPRTGGGHGERGVGETVRDRELEHGDKHSSPAESARSALSGFLPRKERQGVHGPGTKKDVVLKANGSEGRKSDTPQKPLDGRPAASVSESSITQRSSVHAAQQRSSPANGQRAKPQHYAGRTGREQPRPEQGSLAALLQEASTPTKKQAHPTSEAVLAVSPHAIEERTRRADAYYDEYKRHKSGDRPRPVQLLKSVGQSGQRSDVHHESVAPRFKFPPGWSPVQQQAVRPRTAALEIVDLRGRAENQFEDLGRDSRPYKRPRLSSAGSGADAPVVQPPEDARRDAKAAPEDSMLESPQTEKEIGLVAARDSIAPELGTDKDDRAPIDSNMDAVSPRLGKTASAKLRHSTPETIEAIPAHPQSAKPSKPSDKKRTKPWHVLHKSHLKPSTTEDTPATEPKTAAKQTDRSAATTSKQSVSHIRDPPASESMANYHSSPKKASSASAKKPLPPVQSLSSAPSNFGNQYTLEEDALLAELKEVQNVKWEDMPQYFKGRTRGSLQVRYSSKVKNRHQEKAGSTKPPFRAVSLMDQDDNSDSASASNVRKRRKRNNDASAVFGMISWAEVGRRKHLVDEAVSAESRDSSLPRPITKRAAQFQHERAHPRSLTRILRQRELGCSDTRHAGSKPVPDELKAHVFDDVGPLKYHKGTSGDVACLAWSADGTHFAAGSIAISDERSMQYNRPGNLIAGNIEKSCLFELPEHHLPRPEIATDGNVNGLHAMRESQDSRLFMTVATVQFSPDGRTLYSAGTDSKVRAYDVASATRPSHTYAIDHPAPLDLLSVSNTNLLATACHQSADGSIGIYRSQEHLLALSPSRSEQQTNRAIYPSALRWGIAHHHSNLLLAGFSIDSIDEERDIAGETCLWDIVAQQRIHLPVTRNVFDVAWNPRPTFTSTIFAVASTPGTQKVSKGTRTVVQCFAPNQGRFSRVLEWECPAFDINDVMYCQHDDNLLAAGATDGKVYVWDQRFKSRRATPLHVLEHGESLNVLDHDRTREIADTGVRFLSWGATSSRLYTGSSDGVVKIWNPYMATENAHVKDVATFGSAVMSGAFSLDYRDLLIGEDQGRINSLSIGHGAKAVPSMRKLDYYPVPAPEIHTDLHDAAHELIRSQQIVFRPMGDLPVRQAVQGPKYSGPRLMPTEGELQTGQDAYNKALRAQSDARARADMLDDDETLQAAREADRRAAQARETLEKLQSRRQDAIKLYPEAFANQYALHKAEKQRLKLEASLSRALECCKLDCNYLPTELDEDGKVADSGRSEGRIPGNLRLLPPKDTMMLTADELAEFGLKSKCISCFGPAAKPKAGLPLCEICATTRRGLTARCSQCSAPVQPQADSADTLRCEGCSFACFRCSKPARVAKDKTYIRCDTCGLAWTAGVLGYELDVALSDKFGPRQRSRKLIAEDGTEFGEGKMERLAARWDSSG